MELTQKQLREIEKQVSEEISLKTVLLNQFPDAKITIIRGLDTFSYEEYIEDVFFNENQAREAMVKFPLNGILTLPGIHYIVTGTVKDLENKRIYDNLTKQPLDDVDIFMVYDKLQKRLTE